MLDNFIFHSYYLYIYVGIEMCMIVKLLCCQGETPFSLVFVAIGLESFLGTRFEMWPKC